MIYDATIIGGGPSGSTAAEELAKKGFKGKKNADLWKRFLLIYHKHNVSFQWVKGHAGHPENEKCDQLAVEASDFNELLIDQGYEQSIDSNTLF